ncbi:MAG: hypothetical protein ACOCTT_01730 [archaeon]
METIYCKQCQAPVKQLLSDENFEGWRRCHKCDELNYIIATESQEISKQSLSEMLDKLKQNKTGIQTLQFLLDNGKTHEKNIVFCVGKESQTFLDLLTNVGVLEREARKYKIDRAFEKSIQDYIEENICKRSYNKRKIRRNSF